MPITNLDLEAWLAQKDVFEFHRAPGQFSGGLGKLGMEAHMAAFPYRDMESPKASFCASIASESTLIPGICAHLTSNILAKFINKTSNGAFELYLATPQTRYPGSEG